MLTASIKCKRLLLDLNAALEPFDHGYTHPYGSTFKYCRHGPWTNMTLGVHFQFNVCWLHITDAYSHVFSIVEHLLSTHLAQIASCHQFDPVYLADGCPEQESFERLCQRAPDCILSWLHSLVPFICWGPHSFQFLTAGLMILP